MSEDANRIAELQAERCRAVAHPRRILILWSLSQGERSVSEIAQEIQSSPQNTSHHLHIMKEKGILSADRKGQSIYYQIVDPDSVRFILQAAP